MNLMKHILCLKSSKNIVQNCAIKSNHPLKRTTIPQFKKLRTKINFCKKINNLKYILA